MNYENQSMNEVGFLCISSLSSHLVPSAPKSWSVVRYWHPVSASDRLPDLCSGPDLGLDNDIDRGPGLGCPLGPDLL